jgi:hypothetical protein
LWGRAGRAGPQQAPPGCSPLSPRSPPAPRAPHAAACSPQHRTPQVAASAQKRREHFFHVAGSLLFSGATLALFPLLAKDSVAGGFVSISLSLASGAAANGPAIALVAHLCKGPEQVVALPVFSSFAVLGGIAGPLMAGAIINTLVRPAL